MCRVVSHGRVVVALRFGQRTDQFDFFLFGGRQILAGRISRVRQYTLDVDTKIVLHGADNLAELIVFDVTDQHVRHHDQSAL